MKLKQSIERIMNAVFFICGMVSIAAVALITIYMVWAGLPAIIKIGPVDFLLGTVWKSTAAEPQFGILPFILTSVWGMLGALIIGVPVGFVNVVESKELILSSQAPHIVARGRKGGSNVAAAICNALLYQATGRTL